MSCQADLFGNMTHLNFEIASRKAVLTFAQAFSASVFRSSRFIAGGLLLVRLCPSLILRLLQSLDGFVVFNLRLGLAFINLRSIKVEPAFMTTMEHLENV